MNTTNVNLNICYGCMKKLQEGQHVCPSCGYDNSSRQNQDDLLPEGTVLFRKYLIGKVIGRGGFGVTYLGYDLDLEIKVAIKEYFPIGVCVRTTQSFNVVTASAVADTSAFSKGCEVFLDEARTLAKFNSPYIVHVRDFFREHGTAYIVMDYVEGTTLKAEMRKNGGRLPAERVISLMEPLIAQLDELHEKSIIHRDIKPENLILVKDRKGEHLVLLDFGAARAYVSNETKTMTGVVTQGFSPLEQYSQKSRQGPYTDVYALCATMYNAITGAIPPPAIERNIDDTPLKPISEYGIPIKKSAEVAILHGMALRSADRTQTMEQLLKELDPDNINRQEELCKKENLEENQRKEQQKQKDAEDAYLRACDLQKAAKTETEYRKAIQEFRKLSLFSNSEEHIVQCEDEIRKLICDKNNRADVSEQIGKKKSVLPKIFAVCAAVAILAIGIGALSGKNKTGAKGKTDDGLEYELYDNYAVITDYEGKKSSVIIPSSIDGKPVTEIAYSAFDDCKKLKDITIPDSVTEIRGWAFYNCENLTSITIPDGVTTIGEWAFYGCENLTGITIPDSVTEIRRCAFYNCENLTSITIPDGVTTIGGSAFAHCVNLTGITIPDSVTTIGGSAFADCKNMKTIEVDQGNKYFTADNGILYSIDMKTIIAYPSEKQETTFDIPGSVTEIGDSAFSFCNNLTDIAIPDGVTTIGCRAFYNCENLTSITIPDGVTTIGEWAFDYCENLTGITIPHSVTAIGKNAFWGCDNLKNIYFTGTEEQWNKIIYDGFEADKIVVHFNS